jgi:hypothetical protein
MLSGQTEFNRLAKSSTSPHAKKKQGISLLSASSKGYPTSSCASGLWKSRNVTIICLIQNNKGSSLLKPHTDDISNILFYIEYTTVN